MWDDEEKARAAQQANLRNPKNRFLFIFCHAKDIDNSWGCSCCRWSFTTGVYLFSIIVGIASLSDIFFLAKYQVFLEKSVSLTYKVMLILKIASDFLTFIGIAIACFGIIKENLSCAIISYYVVVLSFLINTIFLISSLIAILFYFSLIKYFIFDWAFLEFALLLFCWILFAYEVFLGRKKRAKISSTEF